MSIAFVFPGQGSQAVGMLSAYAEDAGVVDDVLGECSEALGFDLAAVIADGPAERLNATEYTQPAMLAAGVCAYRIWENRGGPAPAALAGHSLGEYTALVCSGALGLASAARLVRRRGQLMQAAVPEGAGAMAAVLGLDDERVQQICRAAADSDVVEAVNFNAPGQVVIAGSAVAVERAMTAARDAGAKRVIALPVSVPSHCALMRPAARSLATDLAEAAIRRPRLPVVNNVDVEAEGDPDRIRDALRRQLFMPVRWVDVVRALAARGVTTLAECGPGRVLAGLSRRIDRNLEVYALDSSARIAASIERLGGAA